ncbi:putative Co/Zn/Cd efflux system membrane fusion protein [Enhygromyxa salina]|uniref:Putative Co/Zn/Cd efflux system membrane fusion protein n=1 Tax=Enhygromyxa salina TaxID=215803 RepID=A0A0C1ZXL0_9BACT|nr:efflux RND transporter periplasmic adaptor subunit [Enhygromyxa salina]KIG15898.1 putative Co/Zn/Cd efflux system membrane fusion protein [Enhygromyxa salina]
MSSGKTWAGIAAVVAALIAGGVALRVWVFPSADPSSAAQSGPVPVEVAATKRGPIERRREFTGTLEAAAEFTVAPKVGGQIEHIAVDLGDTVTHGQLVATLDDSELNQAVAQAQANLTVAQARVRAADKVVEVTRRSFQRIEGLRGRDINSEQDMDLARSDKAKAEAELEVARAEVTRARAALEAAKIRRDYTEIRASWSAAEPGDTRLVAARYTDEGAMLGANEPLLRIVDLDPVIVVVHVTEADYAELAINMPITLRTDAYPGVEFEGAIARIAPVFRSESRQARIEMRVPNTDGRLKPGMFVRARAVLERLDEATIVPAAALVERGGEQIVFEVDASGETVRMRAVEVGVREGEHVAVEAKDGAAISGQVVTLGQQQLVDGAAIVIPERRVPAGGASS